MVNCFISGGSTNDKKRNKKRLQILIDCRWRRCRIDEGVIWTVRILVENKNETNFERPKDISCVYGGVELATAVSMLTHPPPVVVCEVHDDLITGKQSRLSHGSHGSQSLTFCWGFSLHSGGAASGAQVPQSRCSWRSNGSSPLRYRGWLVPGTRMVQYFEVSVYFVIDLHVFVYTFCRMSSFVPSTFASLVS